ncbi:MAG: DUF4386 domain-containing protein [Deltaproteobacteria bacterium]|nr:DUF4386 domain-containing protein [Deltaproteobacteria bacterium]
MLHLIVMASGILSVAPSVDGPDFLVAVAANETQVMRAAFCQMVMMVAYVGFAIVLLPQLKKRGEGLTFGFLSFRVIGGAFILLGVILLPLLVLVSREFVAGGPSEAAYLPSLGGLLRVGRDLVNHVGFIVASSLGSLFLYSLLYRSRLVPRWLSVWGLAGAILALVASLLVLFDWVEVVTATYVALNVPIAAQEFMFAIWLIGKGFDPPEPDAILR